MGKNKKRNNNKPAAAAAAIPEATPEVQTISEEPTSVPQSTTTSGGMQMQAQGKSKNKKNKKNNNQAQMVAQEQETQAQEPEVPQVRKTPEERAQEYADQQKEMYEKILDSFRQDQIDLDKPIDFSDKRSDLESTFKKEELKKAEKQVRKDVNEWDDLFEGGPGLRTHEKGIQKLGDKINKIMKDSVTKSIKKYNTGFNLRDQQILTRDNMDKSLQTAIKTRKTLEFLCTSIFKKNHDLYLQHETMLDQERQLRADLAENFQKRMAEVSEDINNLKETRTAELTRNQDVRKKIQEEVAIYRVHEEKYQKQMGQHQAKMGVIEKEFKGKLEKRIQPVIKKAEEEKAKYDKAQSNVGELSDQIKVFMSKFETLKEEISQSSANFSNFQMDTDTKKAEIMTLETQIESMRICMNKKILAENKIKEDRQRVKKQIATMTGLKKALTMQMKATQK